MRFCYVVVILVGIGKFGRLDYDWWDIVKVGVVFVIVLFGWLVEELEIFYFW